MSNKSNLGKAETGYREYSMKIAMDWNGELLRAELGLETDKLLLTYDKSFVGTRSKNGVISSSEAVRFITSAENFPQVARLLLALDILGVEGAADGLEDAAEVFSNILDTLGDQQNP
nr:hypothetical protein [uncultured Dethiosulfovibrio sp.]